MEFRQRHSDQVLVQRPLRHCAAGAAARAGRPEVRVGRPLCPQQEQGGLETDSGILVGSEIENFIISVSPVFIDNV